MLWKNYEQCSNKGFSGKFWDDLFNRLSEHNTGEDPVHPLGNSIE
jgi:hypothetical protein